MRLAVPAAVACAAAGVYAGFVFGVYVAGDVEGFAPCPVVYVAEKARAPEAEKTEPDIGHGIICTEDCPLIVP